MSTITYKGKELAICEGIENISAERKMTLLIACELPGEDFNNKKDFDKYKNVFSNARINLQKEIEKIHALNNPELIRQKQELESKFKKAFKSADLTPLYIKELPNEYCSNPCCYHLPWFIIGSEVGHIKVGWRKRVIEVEYKDSYITANASELFKEEDTTTGDTFIHAWGYKKLVEYLKTLKKSVYKDKE